MTLLQGVHGTTITVLDAFRKINKEQRRVCFNWFRWMSGAQPKAGNIGLSWFVCK